MANRKKIMVLGARGFEQVTDEARVDCVAWTGLESVSNLRDYDTVVLNLLSVSPVLLSGRFERVLNPFVASEILDPGGEIIVIGDPRFYVPVPPEAGDGKRSNQEPAAEQDERPFLHWTLLDFGWDGRPGDTVSVDLDWRREHYKPYLSLLRRWDYSLRAAKIRSAALAEVYDLDKLKARGLEASRLMITLAKNRYKNALAFEIYIRIGHGEHWGPMIFLPRIDLSEDETLNLVLRDLCGVEGPLPEPQWIAEMRAPGQEPLDAQIADGFAALKEQISEVEAAKAERAAARQVLRLLYDKGPSLEEEVRAALRKLGAQVEDPTEPGKEDGWLSVEIGGVLHEAVLEITGTRGDQFGEDKLRQLLDWVHRGVELRQKKLKGVFVGAAAIDRPPAERPYPFSPSWDTSAKLHGISAIRCEDLYGALASFSGQDDADQKERFWRLVFESSGAVDLAALFPSEPSLQGSV